jgi:hypothetical protein
LRDDRIKYIVKARGYEESLAQLVETALQEESDVKLQKCKGGLAIVKWPDHTGNTGNMKREYRVPKKGRSNAVTSVTCFRCQELGTWQRIVGTGLHVGYALR